MPNHKDNGGLGQTCLQWQALKEVNVV